MAQFCLCGVTFLSKFYDVSEIEWQQVKRLFHLAMDLPPDERKALLDRACIGNDGLRVRVESLLQAHEQAGEFIAEPALIEGPCD